MILDDIIENKKIEVDFAYSNFPLKDLQSALKDRPRPKDFYDLAINHSGLKIIAEVKKASPSKGVICENFNPVEIARNYENNGAFAISVLTDEKFFQGKLEYLSDISSEVDIPVLRKDFTIDPYQIFEARYYGADLVLLIASVLETTQLKEFLDITHSLGMNAIVEVHNAMELEKSLEVQSKIIGINNRDLKTFEVSLSTTEQLSKQIPEGQLIISESGIHSKADIEMLVDLGITTFLIGESFMNSEDPGEKLRTLIQDTRF